MFEIQFQGEYRGFDQMTGQEKQDRQSQGRPYLPAGSHNEQEDDSPESFNEATA